MNVVITQPCAFVGDLSEHTKRYVSERNAKILLCEDYPTNTDYITPVKLLGDPNTALSEYIADYLSSVGILSRKPVTDEEGKHLHVTLNGKKHLLWDYSWALADFSILDEEKLLQVGWDLRHTPGFFNLVVIDNPEDKDSSDSEDEDSEDDEDEVA